MSLPTPSSAFVGIDLGGTLTKFAIADAQGNLMDQASLPTEAEAGPEAVLARLGDVIIQRLEALKCNACAAIGMGVPGLVDIESGITKFLPNLKTQWRDVSVGPWLAKRFGCPVRLLNDVRTATLGELRFGHGKMQDQPTLIFLSLGTGVGGGVVIEGKLRLGPLGSAGEMGHQTVLLDGPRCGCGSRGCLESLASGPAIAAEGARLMQIGLAPQLHQLVDGQRDHVTTKLMSIAAESDDAVREVIVRAGQFIGIALANVITTLHPDIVVVGGGVAQFGDTLFQPIRNSIQERVRMFPTESIEVLPSKLGESAGVMGAVSLAMNHDFPST